jgi:hypothetical protein
MKSEDILENSYWAGFIDGEGSIMITKFFSKDKKHKSPTYQLQIGVATTDKKQMEKLSLFAGGNAITERRFKNKNQRNAYYWGLKSDKAVLFLKRILPYLKLKQKQAKVGIKYQENKFQPNKYGGRIRKLTQKEINYREKWRNKMIKLNHKNSNKGYRKK